MQDKKKAKSYEKGVMKEVTVHQLMDLTGPWCPTGMANEFFEPQGVAKDTLKELFPGCKCEVSRLVRGPHNVMCATDMVILEVHGGFRVAKFLIALKVDGVERALVEPWFHSSTSDRYESTWACARHMQCVHTSKLLHSVHYSMGLKGGAMNVLTPSVFLSSSNKWCSNEIAGEDE